MLGCVFTPPVQLMFTKKPKNQKISILENVTSEKISAPVESLPYGSHYDAFSSSDQLAYVVCIQMFPFYTHRDVIPLPAPAHLVDGRIKI